MNNEKEIYRELLLAILEEANKRSVIHEKNNRFWIAKGETLINLLNNGEVIYSRTTHKEIVMDLSMFGISNLLNFLNKKDDKDNKVQSKREDS